MMKSDKQNRSFFWATLFLRELYSCGVDHLVISPGSRSTPLVMAAAAHTGFKKHVVLDERSAAFVALGIGKAAGKPSALICTSGTAAANYYPAVIEARQSGVPLLVLTADRPPNLRSTGASQAIDQIKLFGNYPVFFHEAGEPILEEEDLDRLRQLASQAVSLSIRNQGPAHINFPFRKPLEPEQALVDKIEKENKKLLSDRTPATSVHYPPGQASSMPESVEKLVEKSKRPLLISGSGHDPESRQMARELAVRLNAPHLAEFPSSGSGSTVRGFVGFLRNRQQRERMKPDLIIRFGRQPVSKAIDLYLKENREIPQIHFGNLDEWHDATHSVTHRIEGMSKNINWYFRKTDTENQWLESWKKLEQNFSEFRAQQLDHEPKLTDGHVFNRISKQLDESWNLCLSNSFPVRDMMLFGEPFRGTTFVNRGASGIDGILSTAIGSSIGSGKPTLLFIGDLALLHDSNALLSSKLLEQPLVVVLLNNRGGTIFRMLPVFEQNEDIYSAYFETPQEADFEKLAKTFGITSKKIDTVEQLNEINIDEYSEPGLHLIECRTDSGASMQLRRTLWNFSPR